MKRWILHGFRLGYRRAVKRYKARIGQLALDNLLIIHEHQKAAIELMCYVREMERLLQAQGIEPPAFRGCGDSMH